ncbi:sigma-70 family RNA polymerase sigma factor, partial [Candidatus Pacearchaeota archaeon]
AQEGDKESRDKLVLHNLGIAIELAWRYKQRVPHVELDDLISEASIGLINAVDNYDPCRRTKFSTYAFDCARYRIQQYLADSSHIRIPNNVRRKVFNVVRVADELRVRKCREPTAEEVAEELNASQNRKQYRPDFVELALRAYRNRYPFSLYQPFYPNDDRPLIKFVAARNGNGRNGVELKMLREDVDRLLRRLDVRERDKKLFRMVYFEGKSKSVAGKKFGLTRERARQICDYVLEELRKVMR